MHTQLISSFQTLIDGGGRGEAINGEISNFSHDIAIFNWLYHQMNFPILIRKVRRSTDIFLQTSGFAFNLRKIASINFFLNVRDPCKDKHAFRRLSKDAMKLENSTLNQYYNIWWYRKVGFRQTQFYLMTHSKKQHKKPAIFCNRQKCLPYIYTVTLI